MSHYLLPICLIFLLASCTDIDETIVTDEEIDESIAITDAWICDMKSFQEDDWYYELYMQDNGDYIAVSESRLLKVSKDGILNSIIMIDYMDNDRSVVKIFNDKIYRFHYDNDFQNFDPTAPIKLQVYDFDMGLLSEQDLATTGLPYDIEIENDETFGLLVYDRDMNTMTLKKLGTSTGLIAEVVLSTNGTFPRSLHIFSNGDYLYTDSSTKNNMGLFDNDLNPKWAREFDNLLIRDAIYVAGEGFFISGSTTGGVFPDRPSFVALLDIDGNLQNIYEYADTERWAPSMQINQDRICLTQTEPETSLNMLMTILDFDLNVESTQEIEGSIVFSEIILNENDSFSFVYGANIDPNDPNTFPDANTRIFKFDGSYDIPTNIIVQ